MSNEIRKLSGGGAILTADDVLLKEHARIFDEVSPALLNLYILCATQWLEEMLGVSFLPAIFAQNLDALPEDGAPIELKRCPAITADGSHPVFKYIASGVETTLTKDTDYRYDPNSEPARIELISSITPDKQINAISLEWKAGYATADAVPAKYKLDCMLLVTYWIEHKVPISTENVKSMPVAWSIENSILNNRITH